MRLPLSPDEKFTFVFEEDKSKPKEKQTVFRLKALSMQQLIDIEDAISGAVSGEAVAAGTVNYRLIKASLIGWENLKDANGNKINWAAGPDGLIRDELLRRFPMVKRAELATAIWKHNNLLEQEAKN